MARYRKRPIEVEAYRWNPPDAGGRPSLAKGAAGAEVRGTSYAEVVLLLGTSGCSKEPPHWDWSVMGVMDTPEGKHVVSPGDWIVTGTKGEKYPVKHAIFVEVYEPVA